jgi:hypothetical protein
MWQPVGWVAEFGEQKVKKNRRGEDVTQGDSAIHLESNWRVVRNGRIILGSDNFLEGREDPYREKSPESPEAKSIVEFFDSVDASRLIVERLALSDTFDVCVDLTDGYRLESFHATSGGETMLWVMVEGESFLLDTGQP